MCATAGGDENIDIHHIVDNVASLLFSQEACVVRMTFKIVIVLPRFAN
jgi:hypothetical protein